jgi:hypothetical protein
LKSAAIVGAKQPAAGVGSRGRIQISFGARLVGLRMV